MSADERLTRISVILKDVSHPGNIGSVARAMKTMGLARLSLVSPKTLIDEQSRALAAGADDILAAAQIYDALPEAIADCTQVFAYTARRRDLSASALDARAAAGDILARSAGGERIALLFGGERSGLENADIQQATMMVEIPTASTYSSLNLAQAVQIAVYELRAGLAFSRTDKERDMPTRREFDLMMAHWRQSLSAVGLPKNGANQLLVPRLRALLTRADLDKSEVRLLRGICRAILNPHPKEKQPSDD